MIKTARFDETRRYRYVLTREWEKGSATVVFILLNPSTADETKDDPTIKRCIAFAKRWGYGAVKVLNLFALRSTYPEKLYHDEDPVGPDNFSVIREECKGKEVWIIVGWGNHGTLHDRGRYLIEALVGWGYTPYCFGLTKIGQPRHPLYVRADTEVLPILRLDSHRAQNSPQEAHNGPA